MTSNQPSPDVPLFLRKTYHMIDTCDPVIATWSDDGETFVVKDPIKFEQTIIPQFFKHSKFSSFVRQLNFYSFRKIKYHDTLRIDPKLEAETANYWRFKHESFQRGKPHLLSKIKRMQGGNNNNSSNSSKNNGAPLTTSSGGTAITMKVTSSASIPETKPQEDQLSVTSEVQTLKKKIEEMTKNIDELAAMVKEVSLKQEENHEETAGSSTGAGFKRKKVDLYQHQSRPDDDDVMRPDEMISSMDLDEVIALPVASMMMPPLVPERMAASREDSNKSSTTQISDLEFVDSLFTAFKDDVTGGDDDDVFILDDKEIPLMQQQQQPENPTSHPVCVCCNFDNSNSNRPDAELMRRLSDALMVLPKDMQEMIVNRLIAAITSTDFVAAHTNSGCVGSSSKTVVAGSSNERPKSTEEVDVQEPFPLAAATLAALLHHYTSQMQHDKSTATATSRNQSGSVEKSIPVIPVHA